LVIMRRPAARTRGMSPFHFPHLIKSLLSPCPTLSWTLVAVPTGQNKSLSCVDDW
jgi:hypothetical protein